MNEKESREYERSHWTLDRRIPIALIITIMAYGVGFVWLESQQNAQIAQLQDIVEDIPEARRRVAVVENEVKNIKDSINRVERKVDNVDNKIDKILENGK